MKQPAHCTLTYAQGETFVAHQRGLASHVNLIHSPISVRMQCVKKCLLVMYLPI